MVACRHCQPCDGGSTPPPRPRISRPDISSRKGGDTTGSTTTVIGYDTIKPIIDAIAAQFNITQIVAVLGGILVITVGLAFFWWAGRKAVRLLMSAFKKGRVGV